MEGEGTRPAGLSRLLLARKAGWGEGVGPFRFGSLAALELSLQEDTAGE
jgi:hypothetical protein